MKQKLINQLYLVHFEYVKLYNKIMQNNINDKSQYLRKPKKLSPLFLLSRVKKSSNQLKVNRQSAIAIMQKQQTKISNRYGQARSKTQNNSVTQDNSFNGGQDIKANGHHSAMSKFDQILGNKRSRYNATHTMSKDRRSSPYLSESRKRLGGNRESQQVENSSTLLKIRLVKQPKQNQQQVSANNSEPIAQQRQLKQHIDPQKISKIFTHFHNMLAISDALQLRKNQRQLIPFIRQYVLQQKGDSAELQNIYLNDQIMQLVKKIIYLEKLIVIVIVDLIINRKFKLAEVFVIGAVRIVVQFYQTVYKDIVQSEKIGQNQLKSQQLFFKNKPKQQSAQNNEISFKNYLLHLQSKLKICFKYSRHLQQYYKMSQSNILSFHSNLSYFRLLQYYSMSLLGQNWTAWNIQFLQVCPCPYLHHQSNKKHTLVLDLDQTLIHYKMGTPTNNYKGEFLIRPYMFQFLQKTAQHFQLGIFTCSLPEYADIIINHMPGISFRLYRHHTIKINNQYVKDLSRIGRSLQNLILVDNLQHNFRLQKENGIHVRSWYGDRNDDVLKRLADHLISIVTSKEINDIRLAQFQKKFL